MANSSRVVDLAIGAVVGGALGFLAGQQFAPTPDCTSLQNRTITISAKGVPNCPVAHAGAVHRVTWIGPEKTTLRIIFPDPSPYPVSCVKNVCESNGYQPHSATTQFDYTGSLTPDGGNSVPVNGRIIIHK